MLASEFTVYVRNRKLERLGVLAEYDELAFAPTESGVGVWTLQLPDQVRTPLGWIPHEMCAALREPGAGIVIRRQGRTVFSGPMVERDLTVTPTERGAWTFTGVSDEAVLEDALAWPNPASPTPQAGELARDARAGRGAAVLVGYVRANIGEGAPAARRGLFAQKLVTAGADLMLGTEVQESARYENLLQVCQRVARQSGISFRVVDEGGRLVLQTYVGRDRTDDTRWTVRHGFLEKLTWEAGAPGVTRPLVGGSGVGEYRPMVAPTTPDALAAELEWGRKRELFIDSQGVDEVAELEQRGVEALEHQTAGLVVSPSELTALGWGSLWELGDLVTLPETGITYPITSVPVKISGGDVSVQAELGSTADEDSAQRSVEARVSNLERNTAPSVLTFEMRSQLDAWPAPDGTHAWVASEKREYVRRAGAWWRVPIVWSDRVTTLGGTQAAGALRTTAVVFPSGLFPSPPHVTLSVQSAAPHNITSGPTVTGVTADGFEIKLQYVTTSDIPVHWHAVLP